MPTDLLSESPLLVFVGCLCECVDVWMHVHVSGMYVCKLCLRLFFCVLLTLVSVRCYVSCMWLAVFL